MGETRETGGLGGLALGGIGAGAVTVAAVVAWLLGAFEPEPPKPTPRQVSQDPARPAEAQLSGTAQTAEPLQGDAEVAQEQDPSTSTVDVSDAVVAEGTLSGQGETTSNAGASASDETVAQTAAEVASQPIADSAVVQEADTSTQEVNHEVLEQVAITADDVPVQDGGQTSEQVAVETAEPLDTPLQDGQTAVSAGNLEKENSEPPTTEASEAATQETTSVAAVAEAINDQAEAEAPKAPVLELVRVDPDGETVIAGRAGDQENIEVLLDGEVIERLSVEPGDEFVAFASIPASGSARVISLRGAGDGPEALSDGSFILAPATPVPASSTDNAETQPNATTTQESEEIVVALADTGGKASETAAGESVAEVQLNTSAEDTASETPAAQPQGEVTEAVAEPASEPVSEPATSAITTDGTEGAVAESTSGEAASDQLAHAAAPKNLSTQAPGGATEEGETTRAGTQLAATDATQSVADLQQPETLTEASGEDAASAETLSAPEPQPAPVAVLRADANGVTVVQPAGTAPLTKVVLDSISYSDDGEVQISGRSQAGSVVRAYLDNRLSTSFTAGGNGAWGGVLERVTPGVYTLRLDELDGKGAVVSRLETPFKREAPEALQLPASDADRKPQTAAPLVRAVTVQKGDTLWAISRERYGSGFLYVRVFEANQEAIRNPDLIYPGQVFTIPD